MPDRTDTERIDWMEHRLIKGLNTSKFVLEMKYPLVAIRQAIDAAMDREQGDE